MMQIKNFVADFYEALSELFQRWFHKRNIIIVSEHKVKHIPISGALQFLALMAAVSGVCWASYSTGSYMSAQTTLREQYRTIRSVVGNKIENTFSVMQSSAPAVADKDSLSSLASPKAALNNSLGSNNIELYARITALQQQLEESQKSKKDFVDQVKKRTTLGIDALENVIEQTGLNVKVLKKQAPGPLKTLDGDNENEADNKDFESQGGPYVPSSLLPQDSEQTEVINNLDHLSDLKKIVENLPVSKPIRNYQERSGFGRRIDPFTGNLAFHSGLDMAGPTGSKIYATGAGTISFAGRSGAYGNMIDIDHGNLITTRYGHLSEILVEDGQQVKTGQIIGIQGSTGRSTGSHLHYEVRYKNQPLNPRNFLLAGRYVPQN
jgi:murein DD-endopeptidase MepM/ murein hydrolase activator NlpD